MQIDAACLPFEEKKRILKSTVCEKALTVTDHKPIVTTLSKICAKSFKKRNNKKTHASLDWASLRDNPITNAGYNEQMETATENFDKEDGDAISNFVQVLSDVALDALPIRPKKKKPWFEENKDTLIPLQKARNLAHTEWKKTKTGLDRKIFNDA